METKRKCLVIMPFAAKFDDVYKMGIKPAVETMKYECVRTDEIAGSGNVIRHLVEFTDEADVVIADITENNPNVMYELGLAHGLRKHVILLTQNIAPMPFDLKNYRIVQYKIKGFGASDDARKKITAALEALNDKRQARTNPVHDFLPDAVSQKDYKKVIQENAELKQQNTKLLGSAELADEILRKIGSPLDMQQIQRRLDSRTGSKAVAVQAHSGQKLVFKRVPKSKRVEVNLPPAESSE